MAADAIAQDEMLIFLGVLVSVLVAVIFLVLAFKVLRQRNDNVQRPALAKEKFFPSIGKISSDAEYKSSGVFSKNVELYFRSTVDGESYLAIAYAFIDTFAKLRMIGTLGSTRIDFMAETCSGEKISGSFRSGELVVRLGKKKVGRVNFGERKIFDAKGKEIGVFRRRAPRVNIVDVIGFPLFGRRGNFRVDDAIMLGDKEACRIGFRKWPDYDEPLLANLSEGLDDETLALVFSIAVFEHVFAVNLKP